MKKARHKRPQYDSIELYEVSKIGKSIETEPIHCQRLWREREVGSDCLGSGFAFGAVKHSGTRSGNG